MLANEVFDSPQRVFDYVSFCKTISPNKIVFITESNRDGQVLKELWSNLNEVMAIYAKGKPICINSSELVYQHVIKGCAALVDADYDNVENPDYKFPVVLTDFHDLEGYSIFSQRWENTLREILSLDKLQKHNLNIEKLREQIVNLCLPLGVVLFINNKFKIGLDFKEYCFGRKCNINYNKRSNSVEMILKRLKELNSDKKIPEDLIKQQYELIMSRIDENNKKQYVSSKMICKCVLAFSKEIGLFAKEMDIDETVLMRWLRSHIRIEDLRDSKMNSSIMKFVEENRN